MENKFTDHENPVIGFVSTFNDVKSTTNNIGVSTTELISSNQCLQTIFKKNVEIQTDQEKLSDKVDYNEEALLQFMRNFAPRVEDELRKRNKFYGDEYSKNWLDEDEFYSKKLYELQKHKHATKVSVRHICWSSYGNKIAVNLSFTKHDSWCSHEAYVLIYECDTNEEFTQEAEECISVDTCINDIKFHPFINSLLVFATKEGKIYLHNSLEKLGYNENSFIRLESNEITQISWIEIKSIVYLVVSDLDGIMYLWSTSSNIEEWSLKKKYLFKMERGIHCFAFSPLNQQNFVVGLEGGLILRCSMLTAVMCPEENNLFYPVISKFEHSSLFVYNICFSSFEESIFLTTSIDGRIRIYTISEKAPINIIVPEHICVQLEWSHVQENIFKAWTADGEIHFYNYKRIRLMNYFKVGDELFRISSKVKGTKQLFAVCNSKNDIEIWQTSLIIK